MRASEQPRPLLCHPMTSAPMVRALEAGVTRAADGGLLFNYRLTGDMSRLLIPTPQPEGRSDGLWEHTCFEAFIGIAGSSVYREFNFSPSGQWAMYAFSGYRLPEVTATPDTAPQISALLTEGRLELSALLTGDALAPEAGVAALQIGLSAVIESRDTVDGNRSYWALRHPASRPDFHHREAFVLDLPAPLKSQP